MGNSRFFVKRLPYLWEVLKRRTVIVGRESMHFIHNWLWIIVDSAERFKRQEAVGFPAFCVVLTWYLDLDESYPQIHLVTHRKHGVIHRRDALAERV